MLVGVDSLMLSWKSIRFCEAMAQITFVKNRKKESNLTDLTPRTQSNRSGTSPIILSDMVTTQLINRLIREEGTSRITRTKLVRQLKKLGISDKSQLTIVESQTNGVQNMLYNIQQNIRWGIGELRYYIHTPLCSGGDIILQFDVIQSADENLLSQSIEGFYRAYIEFMVDCHAGFRKNILKKGEVKRRNSSLLLAAMFDREKVAPSNSIQSVQHLEQTLRCFLVENLNPTTTARKMKLHRNTVLYRIAQIKKLTGLDPTNFVDAVILSEQMDQL